MVVQPREWTKTLYPVHFSPWPMYCENRYLKLCLEVCVIDIVRSMCVIGEGPERVTILSVWTTGRCS